MTCMVPRYLIWLWWCHEVAYYIYKFYMMMIIWYKEMFYNDGYVKVAYGEIWWFSRSRLFMIMGDVSSGREVGVSPWCITAWSTYPSRHQCRVLYMIFFGFMISKTYMYHVFKSICIIKGTLVVSSFALAWHC